MSDARQRFKGSGGVGLHVIVHDGHAPGNGITGAPFLLVHGLASNARLWDGVARRLADLGHPVAALDQRGHGRSDKPDEGYDFATLTDDLVAVIDGLGYRRPVVVGQSWGGNVVLELAVRHDDVVRAIACIDGGVIELSRRFATWESCLATLTPPPSKGLPAAAVEAGLRQAHPDWPETGIQGAKACFEVRGDGTVAPWLSLDRHLRILRELWLHRPSERFGLVEGAVLLLPADTGNAGWVADKRADVALAQALVPDGRCRVHWMAGDHDLHAQHPVEVADLLHDFADGLR